MLDCMTPLFAQAAAPPRRMLIIANNLGVLPRFFFPHAAGRDCEFSPYLTALVGFRSDFTVFSRLSLQMTYTSQKTRRRIADRCVTAPRYH
jgi:hypothetical protein